MGKPHDNASGRVRRIASHINQVSLLAETRHVVPDVQGDGKHNTMSRRIFRFQFRRKLIKILFRETGGGGHNDTYAGIDGVVVLKGELLIPSTSDDEKKTVLIVMHPSGLLHDLPMTQALARAGMHVLSCGTRYANNDTGLMMEKVLRDMAQVVQYCRGHLGYNRVVLAGWSGGGSLSCYYQATAEREAAAAGTGSKGSSTTQFPMADAMYGWSIIAFGQLVMAAHTGRAQILTEWLDPSIYLLTRNDPVHDKEAEALRKFNLYDTRYSPSPPYTAEYVAQFREAQRNRSRRITRWVHAQLRRKEQHRNDPCPPTGCFVVEGTMADPRWLDNTIDPNGRVNGTCFLGDPRVANDMPTGLARFCTLLSWLSQWSFEESPGDGVHHIMNVRVPTLVLENSCDDAVPPSHLRSLFAASGAADKQHIVIEGANHYYDGQKEHLAKAVEELLRWLTDRGLVSVALPTDAAIARGGSATVDGAAAVLDTQQRFGREAIDAFEIKGINHLAITCSDMERTCRFYSGVLGMRLHKTIALPRGGQHFFFSLGDGNSLAFFWFPNAPPADPGSSAPDLQKMLTTGEHPTAHGAMNHVALNVPEHRLEAYRTRIEASQMSAFVSPVVYHADVKSGFSASGSDDAVTFASVYFFGPDGELLELTSQRHTFAGVSGITHAPRKALHRA